MIMGHEHAFTVTPVAWVRSSRAEAIDDMWGDVTSVIELDDAFGDDALAGLDAFSHLEVVYVFDRVADDAIETGARHPRGRADWPRVGIFAQRARRRPNRLGVTRCRLLRVDGRRLHVADLDAIDGTPVVDIKPHMTAFDARGPVREPAWVTELMRDYWSRSR